MSERALERWFEAECRRRGLLTTKIAKAGWPDRLVVGASGRVAFVELKAPGRTTTKLQRYYLDKLDAYDHPNYVCRTKEECLRALDDARL